MADDDNTVVPGPNGGKNRKTAQQMLAEIGGEKANNRAKEFKTELKAAVDEMDKAEKVFKLACAKVQKLMADFDAENSV